MGKSILTLFFSIIVGMFFVLFDHLNFVSKVPGFRCESFGCIGHGVVLFVISVVVIPLLFGILRFIFSKENRLKQAFSSFGISLIVMLLSLWTGNIWNQIEIKQATEEGHRATQELYKKMNKPLSQLSQELPLLDARRPITISNQLTNSTTLTKSPFVVQVYAREDATLADGTLQTKIRVFVPGSIERKDITTGKLFSSQKRSADGRIVFEGTILFKNTFGATQGYLSVIGKDGVTDSITLTFR